ncbi:MAG: AmmeMemoRadiSam system protein B [Desulfomonilia bacterium]|nr:AmmeMemoRadiSam system protein B [Desulfomonilia bacterium]
MKYPRLRRDIQVIPVMVNGQQMVSFADPLKLSRGLAVERSAIPVIQLLDGTHDLRDIQMEMIRHSGGQLIPLSVIEEFIKGLDKSFLLESESFDARKNAIREGFLNARERECSLAGTSYDADPEVLKRYIREVETTLPGLGSEQETPPAGLLAPHIDIEVAKTAYVDLYRRIKGMDFTRVIIFGINHQGREGLYSISEKNYRTPLGTLQTDAGFVSELKARVADGTFAADDFDHMNEHSIEFQALFLRHYLGNSFRIVPVLCGGIHEWIESGRDLLTDDRFVSFVSTIQDLVRTDNEKTLLVAGVDFSHIGLKFGHGAEAGQLIDQALGDDETIISHLSTCDAGALFSHAAATGDRYNVCGLPAMIVFSRLLSGCTGKLLAHETYDEPATRSAVTYASMFFT